MTSPRQTANTIHEVASGFESPGWPAGFIKNLGDFKIIGELGRGGMARVERAWERDPGRMVAIKRLRQDSAAARAAMRRELEVLSHLDHGNVIRLLGCFDDGAAPALVMEYIRGWDIEHVVRRQLFDRADFAAVARQSLAGLQEVHRAGLVHGDLKPGNLMLEARSHGGWRVVLLDFGLCSGAPAGLGSASQGSMGDVGSFHFLAPERFDGRAASFASDLYALGSVLYYLLTGRYAVEGDTEIEIMAGHLLGKIEPLEPGPQLSPAMAEWVMSLIATEPERRPQDADEAADSFEELAAVGGAR